MRRVGVVVTLLMLLGASVAGCASENHTWQGEFDARLEGATGTLEEAIDEANPQMSPGEYFTTFRRPANKLFFKSQLIKNLDPPVGCEALQVKGGAAVYGAAERLGTAFKDLTPMMERDFRAGLEAELARMEKLEREAGSCE
jgi:hypothetical protein